MNKETFNVKGMSCEHCVSAIEGSVGQLKGVADVRVDLSKGQVEVKFDPSVITREKIIETIDHQGYDVD
ncbi:copper ion binding protein [Caldalkalibacillus thermarum TA2.A1]|uniref:Copper chaperone CopZ n=1 Tax=Caldalkalibacillus thermarum (strain TA2.A1) TaxID=986075 RepID=F5L2Z6_CALTT|nr:copper chaperone CopZ [Caldalkalibacillus thermarum]EGL84285.1 copper ion binding protein [Caldalkalibacillus thermarum TA2.A1]QZT35028.1 copper chaperone CopZ [Caldalkalibacillus thermarum TA2.A1]